MRRRTVAIQWEGTAARGKTEIRDVAIQTHAFPVMDQAVEDVFHRVSDLGLIPSEPRFVPPGHSTPWSRPTRCSTQPSWATSRTTRHGRARQRQIPGHSISARGSHRQSGIPNPPFALRVMTPWLGLKKEARHWKWRPLPASIVNHETSRANQRLKTSTAAIVRLGRSGLAKVSSSSMSRTGFAGSRAKS